MQQVGFANSSLVTAVSSDRLETELVGQHGRLTEQQYARLMQQIGFAASSSMSAFNVTACSATTSFPQQRA